MNDPQCYKSRDIPRAASDVRRAKSEIDRARESLRSGVAKELDEYRASFESAYDMDAVPEEARLSLAEIFDQAAARLAEEQSSLRIRTFLESFKDAKAASIVSLLNPPAAASTHAQENDESDGEAAESQPVPARTQAPMTCALSSLRAGLMVNRPSRVGRMSTTISRRCALSSRPRSTTESSLRGRNCGHRRS